MYHSFDKQKDSVKGIGVDICSIDRFRAMPDEKHASFAKKILTEHETNEYSVTNDKPQYLAKIFCCKEAVSKSFGTGFHGIGFTDIEITKDDLGRPFVCLSDKGSDVAQTIGISQIDLSVSHEKDYVVCFVVST